MCIYIYINIYIYIYIYYVYAYVYVYVYVYVHVYVYICSAANRKHTRRGTTAAGKQQNKAGQQVLAAKQEARRRDQQRRVKTNRLSRLGHSCLTFRCPTPPRRDVGVTPRMDRGGEGTANFHTENSQTNNL